MFVRRRDRLRRAFGEPAVVGQEPPDDARQTTSNDHQGVGVLLALRTLLSVNASEVVMTATDHEGAQVQGTSQERGTAFADLASPLDRVARIVPAGVKASVGDVLLGRGSGATFSSYSANAVPYSTAMSEFVAEATGIATEGGDNTLGVFGTDQQSGTNNTSYNFQTYAAFNGIDWSETGVKTTTGSGSVIDNLSASTSGLTYDSVTYGATGSNGVASFSGTSGTSFSYGEQAFLNDNGAWMNSGGSGSLTASGSDSWSVSGGGNPYTAWDGTTGSLFTSGSGQDFDSYSQQMNYTPAGQWEPYSGSGSASGSGYVESGWSTSGDYGYLVEIESPGPNTEEMPPFGWASDEWSGSASESAADTLSYGYSTTSTFSPSAGWSSSGSGSVTGSTESGISYSASTPYSWTQHGVYEPSGTATLSGIVTGSGTEETVSSYTVESTLQSDGSWGDPTSSTAFSGGSSWTWGYSGSGTFSQQNYVDTVVLQGSMSQSGSESLTSSYGISGPVSGPYSGSNSSSGAATFTSSYSGSGTAGSETDTQNGWMNGSFSLNDPGTLNASNEWNEEPSVSGSGTTGLDYTTTGAAWPSGTGTDVIPGTMTPYYNSYYDVGAELAVGYSNPVYTGSSVNDWDDFLADDALTGVSILDDQPTLVGRIVQRPVADCTALADVAGVTA
jgi:trimeric autotransporter adhesin